VSTGQTPTTITTTTTTTTVEIKERELVSKTRAMNNQVQKKRVLADDYEQTKFPGASFFISTNFNSNNMKSTHNSSSSKQATAASNRAIAAANAAGSKDID